MEVEDVSLSLIEVMSRAATLGRFGVMASSMASVSEDALGPSLLVRSVSIDPNTSLWVR